MRWPGNPNPVRPVVIREKLATLPRIGWARIICGWAMRCHLNYCKLFSWLNLLAILVPCPVSDPEKPSRAAVMFLESLPS
jgi:hypothetical protein